MKTILNLFHTGSGNSSGCGHSGAQLKTRSAFMRKDLSAIGLSLVLSGAAVLSTFAADPATVTLRNQVPSAVSKGKAHLNGRVAGETAMNFSIGLPLRNQDELGRLIQQVSDSSNPNYGHYLTPQEFTQRFGPTEKDYQAVINFAKRNGFIITATHPNRMLLSLSGKAADVEKAFSVHLNRYQHPTEQREFFAPDREPTVDGSLHVLRIEGLDNFYVPHPNLKRMEETFKRAAKAAATPNGGSGPTGAYQGTDFRNAYVPGSTLNGKGQNVGLLQFDGFFASDIAAYAAQIGLTNVPNVIVVPIDGGVPIPTPFGNPEVSLDIDMVLSMSPGVGTIFVYEAPNPSPFADILNRMVTDNSSKQLSSSWGGGGPDPISEQIFQQMAVQGQSFFQASGDSDAYLSGEPIPFASDSPHITVVGGTTLTTGPAASYTSEAVWNWGIEFGIDGIGSSGGISTFYTIPTYQTNINFGLSGGSSTLRNIPDVALTGDNVWVIFGAGQSGAFGGTSCAAPLWNGFTALVNQQAAANSHPTVGFLNPALYALAANRFTYTNAFHDVTILNNTWSQSPSAFFAVSNYDLCTGLGTPNGTNMINSLLFVPQAPVHISPPPPPYGTTMASLSGGNPNGNWSVFMQDDSPIGSGSVSNGWVLSVTVADIVGQSADLQLLMTSPNTNVFAGQTATFVLSVTNYGPSPSTNVIVADSLPLGVTLVSTNTTQGSVIRSGSTINWNVGNLAVGAGAQLVLTVQTTQIGSLVNSAVPQPSTPDPNPDDDLASITVNVTPLTATMIPTFNKGSGTFQINVPSPTSPPVTVIIQANTNLAGTNWVNVYTNTPPFTFSDPTAGSQARRFYRAILLP